MNDMELYFKSNSRFSAFATNTTARAGGLPGI